MGEGRGGSGGGQARQRHVGVRSPDPPSTTTADAHTRPGARPPPPTAPAAKAHGARASRGGPAHHVHGARPSKVDRAAAQHQRLVVAVGVSGAEGGDPARGRPDPVGDHGVCEGWGVQGGGCRVGGAGWGVHGGWAGAISGAATEAGAATARRARGGAPLAPSLAPTLALSLELSLTHTRTLKPSLTHTRTLKPSLTHKADEEDRVHEVGGEGGALGERPRHDRGGGGGKGKLEEPVVPEQGVQACARRQGEGGG